MPEFRIGLDLGQLSDHTVAIAVERALRETGHRRFDVFDNSWPEVEDVFYVRAIERWPLRTLFSRIIADVGRMASAPTFGGNVVLYYDRTGVGGFSATETITDAWKRGDLPLARRPYGISTTAGEKGRTAGTRSKTELVDRLISLVTSGRLIVHPDTPGGRDLQAELEAFAPKITASGAVGYEAKEGHDDHVAALALAVHSTHSHGLAPRWLEVINGERVLVTQRWKDRKTP